MNPIHIPPRLNGYDIVAAASNMPGTNEGFDDRAMIILGHDPTRRTGKYATAMVDARAGAETIREWYMGHYFEDLNRAQADFLERTRMREYPQFGCGDPDCTCPDCPTAKQNARDMAEAEQ